ncbi:MAG TPA: radical SAM protein [Thermoanaerobaculia bacterium]|nr:radical SAM protein [Thermoanaerobaculia bacterium]HUM29608.1 radical SAM protein [Thermoanaerobaculia bacterium]HXK67259.1 radical SAM protein [Thermoanaerobaculia bacterium]
MEIRACSGQDGVARVFVGRTDSGKDLEFVESWDPGVSPEDKWVIIVSSLDGCPYSCSFCDAGGAYRGILSREEILQQILHLIESRYPDRRVPIRKFKVQFARVGEPSLNPAVLDVLETLPDTISAPGLIPCLSTVAPKGKEEFFHRLTAIKNRRYPNGAFQLQFSLHSTDDSFRKNLIHAKIWDLKMIRDFGETWFQKGDRKITLNFALCRDVPFEPDVVRSTFSPAKFLVKITPINPTTRGRQNRHRSAYPDPPAKVRQTVQALRDSGFTVIESIGDLRENAIGSNCGQFLSAHRP